MISLRTGSYAPARADIREDFPLRGAISCACCGHPFTACWSTSKTGTKHAYYMCFAKGCARYRKSIRRDVVEQAFVELLSALTPAPSLVTVARAMFKDAWSQRLAQAAEIARACERELARVEKQIATLLERIVDASSQAVVTAYEKKIDELEREKLLLAERRAESGKNRGSFERFFELAVAFLSNPCRLWETGRIEQRKAVLRLTFADRLAYCPNEGFRTPKISMPFKLLGELKGRKSMMAETESANEIR